MSPLVDPDAVAYGEGFEVGYRDGVEFGRAQRGGEFLAGVLARAAAAEKAATTATTVGMRNTSANVAEWLRGLADEIRAGEL